MDQPPTLLWLRRDLRIGDHPGWQATLKAGGPVVPVFILDDLTAAQYGAAALWRLGLSLGALARDLEKRGSRLILRRGEALTVLRALIRETGARRVVWSRLYDQRARDRDTAIKSTLKSEGVAAESVNASLLFEPWTVATKTGGPYRVYTPFWREVRGREIGSLRATPGNLAPPAAWPASDDLESWHLGQGMRRGAAVVTRHVCVGESQAMARLDVFIAEKIARYKSERDRPDIDATSRLSENLAYGEISPRQAWHAAWEVRECSSGAAASEAEHFLKELAWREFAYHLLFHFPEIETRNWRPEWSAFPWRADNPDAEQWRRGMTGVEMVDAALREMYVTGTMHNRCRMVAASFLTKHLMTDWRVGAEWFRECLIDWDPASNAMGWQWTAGSGPDAAPYFRVYNPEAQAEKFDPAGRYRARFLAEGQKAPHEDALSFFEAAPRAWGLDPGQPYPAPMIELSEGRERALAAYRSFKAEN